MGEITWVELTEGEQNDLLAISKGEFDDKEDYAEEQFPCYMALWNKGLISRKYEHTYVTDLGRAVLAQAVLAGDEGGA